MVIKGGSKIKLPLVAKVATEKRYTGAVAPGNAWGGGQDANQQVGSAGFSHEKSAEK